jgi:hypothetical protein
MTPIKHRYRSPTSIWKPSKEKSDEESDVCSKLRKSKTHISIRQALTVAALSAAFAAVAMALIAVKCFSRGLPNVYSDQLVALGVISEAPDPTSPSTSWKIGLSGLDDQNQAATGLATSRVGQERQDAPAEEEAEDRDQAETEVATSRVEQERQDTSAEEETKRKNPMKNEIYASKEELDARSSRFPSVEARVKFSMSDWYVPPCADSDGAVVLYQPLSWNETSKRRSYVLREISHSSRKRAALIEVESSMKADAIFLLDPESLYEEKRNTQNLQRSLRAYAEDAFQTIVPLLDSLRGAPLLTQWGDGDGASGCRFGQPPDAPRIGNTAAPIIKKFRAVISRDELDRVTSAECHDANQPHQSNTKRLLPGIVWKLNSERHFLPLEFVEQNDIPWDEKMNQAVSRGSAMGVATDSFQSATTARDKCLALARCRIVLLSGNSTLLDIRLTSIDTKRGMESTVDGIQLVGKKLSMQDQLRYKAIIMVQGNDVASGLKWALMSNSVLMIPPPTLTTWAMEELLEPWVHYIPLDASLSDAEEKMQWVVDHDREAQQIAHRGGLWMKDMVFHPDAAKDDQAIYEEILQRYRSHFRASDVLLV